MTPEASTYTGKRVRRICFTCKFSGGLAHDFPEMTHICTQFKKSVPWDSTCASYFPAQYNEDGKREWAE